MLDVLRKGIQLLAALSLIYTVPLWAGQDLTCDGNQHVVDQCINVHGRVYFTASSQIILWPVGTNRLLHVPFFNDLYGKPGTAVPLPDNLKTLIEDDKIVFGDFNVCPFTRSEPKVMQSVCIARATKLLPLTRDEFKKLQNKSTE